jgi:hypothetical protein
VLVSEEEHNRAGIVELIHRVEVWNLGNIHEIKHSKILNRLCDGCQHLVHLRRNTAGKTPASSVAINKELHGHDQKLVLQRTGGKRSRIESKEGSVKPNLHTSLIPIMAETNDHSPLLLRKDGLVHGPSRVQMW